jgi:hypothetical protein
MKYIKILAMTALFAGITMQASAPSSSSSSASTEVVYSVKASTLKKLFDIKHDLQSIRGEIKKSQPDDATYEQINSLLASNKALQNAFGTAINKADGAAGRIDAAEQAILDFLKEVTNPQ